MDVHNLHSIYFLGIGGIGMSALARYFKAAGVRVTGYDKTITPLTLQLEEEGMLIHYQAMPNLIPEDCDIVIYTPAVPQDFEEWAEISRRNLPVYKRAEALSMLCKGKKSIAVAGTHGKTTVTAMIAHILHKNNFPLSAFVGGIMSEYNSNVFINADAEWILVEADEYDRSFLRLHPDIAVVNAIDADHLDIYGSKTELELAFLQFMQQCRNSNALFVNAKVSPDSFDIPLNAKKISTKLSADFQAVNIRVENGVFTFDVLKAGGIYISNAQMPLAGRHNIENALAAIAVTDLLDISPNNISCSLATFKGVKRRLELICRCGEKYFYDDYAHHPEEIRALIAAIRELHPDKAICGIFQPHLFSRTRDFADEFGQSLSLLDRAIITDIYPAREKPIEGVDAHFLLSKTNAPQKGYIPYMQIVEAVCRFPEQVILSIGAGDIDRLLPVIKEKLLHCQ